MKTCKLVALLTLLYSLSPLALMADDYDYHPALTGKFLASLGAMKSSNSLELGARGSGSDNQGFDIDFDESLRVADSTTYFNGNLRWNFGSESKWSVWVQYFSNNAKGNVTLDEDIEWNDVIFEEGTYVGAGVRLAVTRLFFGRSFLKSERQEFGVGIGIHHLDISAFIEGEARLENSQSFFSKESVSAKAPLPNVGGWYYFSPARNWLLHARVDWIDASIGEYNGGLWNASTGVSYQFMRNMGINLSWHYFNLHGDVDKNSWNGSLDMTYSGPVVALDFAW
jgi:opacity protein-like surface antigen